jgi:hypothetical protein
VQKLVCEMGKWVQAIDACVGERSGCVSLNFQTVQSYMPPSSETIGLAH